MLWMLFFRKMLSISCMTTHTCSQTVSQEKYGEIIQRYDDISCNSQWYRNWSDRRMCMTHNTHITHSDRTHIQCMWCALIYSSFGCCQCFLFIRPKFIVYTLIFIEMRQTRHGKSHIAQIPSNALIFVIFLAFNNWTLKHPKIIGSGDGKQK